MKKIICYTLLAVLCYGLFRRHKKILVFDIDNTLVHAKKNKKVSSLNMSLYRKPDFNIYNKVHYDVWIRPHCKIIIFLLSKVATLHIFTAAEMKYANDILAHIDKHKKYFDEIYYEDTWKIHQSKNLDVFFGDNKNKILIDDRNFNNYKKDNTLFYHIPSYKVYNKYDFELVKFLIKWIFIL